MSRMITKSSVSIRKWLRKSNNREVHVAYRKARCHLDSLIKEVFLSPNFTSKPENAVAFFCQENFSEYGDDFSQLLDDAINSILISYLWLGLV